MKRRWFIPEAVQTSDMDCGPTCLKSILQGYYLAVNFGRLRDICQTEVDGTSIDVIEELAVQLGLPAEQILLPEDYIRLKTAQVLPCILVIALPNAITHFIVVWRRLGPWVQIMDPAYGRRWVRWSSLLAIVYQHRMEVPADQWQEWATGEEAEAMMRERIGNLGLKSSQVESVWQTIATSPDWETPAHVDSVIRWTASLLDEGALKKGSKVWQFVQTQLQIHEVPAEHKRVVAAEQGAITIKAAVLLRMQGDQPPATQDAISEAADKLGLLEPETKPLSFIWKQLTGGNLLLPVAICCVSAVAAASVMLQAIIFSILVDINRLLGVGIERWGFVGLLLLFIAASSLLYFALSRIKLNLGRKLETGLRRDLLLKLPRLQFQYIRTRLLTDMAERSHNLHLLREIPVNALELVETGFLLLFTLVGIAILFPSGIFPALLLTLVMISAPYLITRLLGELDNRTRTLVAIINRLYYDSLRGLLPLRSHNGERSQILEQEKFLSQWGRSHRKLNSIQLRMQLLLEIIGLAMIGWILFSFLQTSAVAAPSLLFVYWLLNLSLLGEELSMLILKHPRFRNIFLRYMEFLTQPEQGARQDPSELTARQPASGVAIDMTDVALSVAGSQILQDIQLSISPGEQIAIVGKSGAGKSSLLGLLTGQFHQYEGAIEVDQQPLDCYGLYPEIVWIDPSVQLWNRSIAANLSYGQSQFTANHHVGELLDLITQLPQGIKTQIGEGGCTLSGGEGQRLRIGRSLGRLNPRLVLLDEPCRGLDRHTRHRLLEKFRLTWPEATMLCVTHDISEAELFPRVIVIEGGTIVEDSIREERDTAPIFQKLRAQEEEILSRLTRNKHWRYWQIIESKLVESREPFENSEMTANE